MGLVEVKDLKVHFDDRGYLFEVIHDYELPEKNMYVSREEFKSMFGQVYVVGNPVRGTIRAFHRHKTLWDYFCIVNGSAKFVFVKSEFGSSIHWGDVIFSPDKIPIIEDYQIVTISAKSPKMIVVPPTTWHGWMSLEDNTVLVSIASEVYNKENPDEERIAPDIFYHWIGDVWKVTAK